MSLRKNQVMSQEEIILQSYEIETDEYHVNEDTIEVDQVETVQPTAKVYTLADFRKAMGYSK